MVSPAMEAARILEQEGVSAGVVNCRFVKPLDKRLAQEAEAVGKVLVVEDNIRLGGLGGALLELFGDMGVDSVRVKRMGLPDQFVEHGPLAVLREKYGLDTSGILKEARHLCGQNVTKG
jgi:1-deoxy-D-xylulose-5-phosphate synthase